MMHLTLTVLPSLHLLWASTLFLLMIPFQTSLMYLKFASVSQSIFSLNVILLLVVIKVALFLRIFQICAPGANVNTIIYRLRNYGTKLSL